MTSPSFELKKGVFSALRGDATVAALVSGRIYDRVPASAPFPYISMGPVDELSDDADCVVGYGISLQIDCWSQAFDEVECHKMSDAVRAALRNYNFSLTDNALVFFRHRQTRTFRDADGVTTHAAMDFEAFVEQPS